MDYKETIKERLGILPEGLRSFILDENWRRETEKIGKQFNFDEEKYTIFENEVFLVLLCFEPRKDFIQNIKQGLAIDSNMANWVSEDVSKNVLNKVKNDLDEVEKQINENENSQPSQTKNIGQSFEQIILNQAKAMQPAREVTPPSNLPTGNSAENLHNYKQGEDPYREPIE